MKPWVDLFSFVFWRKLKTPKRHFEINWPLAGKSKKKPWKIYLDPQNMMLNIHCKPIPVMKTGISLCSISNREKPVFINWEPCNENRFFPVWKYYTGKTLFCPCTGPIRDCSVVASKPRNSQYLPPLDYVHTKPILPKSYGLDPAVQCNMSLKRL